MITDLSANNRRALIVAPLTSTEASPAGAERLIVDAACETVDHGHSVSNKSIAGAQLKFWRGVLRAAPCMLLQVDVYTAYHDKNRCFPETISGTFPVIQAGNWFPRSFYGRLHAFCAYVRTTLAALWLAWCAYRSVAFCKMTDNSTHFLRLCPRHNVNCRQHQHYDVIIVDQVSIVIPFLQLLTRSKVCFTLVLADRSEAPDAVQCLMGSCCRSYFTVISQICCWLKGSPEHTAHIEHH